MDLLERIENLVSDSVIEEGYKGQLPLTDGTLEEIAADLIPPDEARQFANELKMSAHNDREVSEMLKRANSLLGGHGIEVIRSHDHDDRYWGRAVALYVNMGDQYHPTLWYDVYNQEFLIEDWSTYMRFLEGRYDNLTQR